MGHPLGATGCMIAGTLMDELEKLSEDRGATFACNRRGDLKFVFCLKKI